MNSKKHFIVIVTLATCLIGLQTTLWGQELKDPNEEIKLLQEKIKQLEKTIESQQKRFNQLTARYNDIKKQLDEQIKENERLKDKISPAMPAKTNFDPNDGIIYRGKKRNKLWFYRTYRKFCDKLAYVDGKYIDVGRQLAGYHNLDSDHMTWPIGSPVQFPYDSKVISVIKEGEVLISNGIKYSETLVIHLHNLDGTYVVGQDFPDAMRLHLIYTGIFEYEAAFGRKMTVPSLTPYRPLTKEQFAEAINSGIDLIIRKENNGKITETPIR
jgi:cell division protein FtsB